jgi:hypothetical protein
VVLNLRVFHKNKKNGLHYMPQKLVEHEGEHDIKHSLRYTWVVFLILTMCKTISIKL